MMANRGGLLLSAALATVSAAACASVPPASGAAGVLSDYSALQPVAKNARARVADPSEFQQIQRFCVVAPDVRAGAGLSEPDRAAVAAALTTSLRTALARLRPVVDAPAADCAEVRTTVTTIVKSNVVENAVFGIVVLPFLPSNGGVAIEGEVRDARGRQIAALVWGKAGSPFSLIDGLKATGQARALTRDFSKRLADTLSPPMPGGPAKL